ncbi:MAG: HIT family protein [Acidimicrobiia bacterium]|nr:HIT family protein [Acidimicrobiia bacterium]NNK91094.1 HIT family protein [Acidimicrobiia bacterium]
MASVFTRIMDGELPGRFVWQDDVCTAFLSINPLAQGHTLVVPRVEVDHWLDLEPVVVAHLFEVAGDVGRAQRRAFGANRIGLMIAGLEVPHTHLHVVPISGVHDLDFANAIADPDPADLDAAAAAIVAALDVA